tara:strand:- start:231 stop:455 length:225 start_codon:yes stop_codon:yes gene_type:complete
MNLPNSNYLQVLILGGGYNGIVIVAASHFVGVEAKQQRVVLGRQGIEPEESSGQGVFVLTPIVEHPAAFLNETE